MNSSFSLSIVKGSGTIIVKLFEDIPHRISVELVLKTHLLYQHLEFALVQKLRSILIDHFEKFSTTFCLFKSLTS